MSEVFQKAMSDYLRTILNTVSNSGTGGILSFNTITDLQNAYPNGLNQPVWVIADQDWYYWNGTVTGDTTPPVITCSSSGGTFATSQNVTLSANESSTIYYTLDGSTPTTASSVYSSALNITSTSTLKFFGKDNVGNQSAVQSISFTITTADTTPPVITASPIGGTYTGSQSVTLSANETATIYYTTDGSTPTISSTVYSTPITVSASETIQFIGKDTAGNISTPASATYTIQSASGTIVVNDDFNRSDGSIGNTLTGQTWNSLNPAPSIISNQVGWTTASGNIAWVDSTKSDNVAIEMDIVLNTLTGGGTGAVPLGINARTNGSTAVYFGLKLDGTAVEMLNNNSGASAVPGSVSFSALAGQSYHLKLEITGNVYKGYVDGVLKMTYTDSGNAGLSSTKHGFSSYNNTVARFDNFKITTL